MQPSGLNSIEYGFHIIGTILKWVCITLGVLVIGPVLWALWSWSTMTYQREALRGLNAPQQSQCSLAVDFNQCTLTDQAFYKDIAAEWKDPHRDILPFKVVITQNKLQSEHYRVGSPGPPTPQQFVNYLIPWAPAQLYDPRLKHGVLDALLEPAFKVNTAHYRLAGDSYADPWYAHGLFKIAPTKRWDWGSGIDYAFGKSAPNYYAYVAAARAVATMRLLLGWHACHLDFAQCEPLYEDDVLDPVAAVRTLEQLTPQPISRQTVHTFIQAYAIDWQGKLPAIAMDLNQFKAETFYHANGFLQDVYKYGPADSISEGWGYHMGWCPLNNPGRNWMNSHPTFPDWFITNLRFSDEDRTVTQSTYTCLDFLVHHRPSTTAAQNRSLDALTSLLENDTWDKLLPDDKNLRAQAHMLLHTLRRNLDLDYAFARKYGHVFFSGDHFDYTPSIMK